jgi:hypothetical protein
VNLILDQITDRGAGLAVQWLREMNVSLMDAVKMLARASEPVSAPEPPADMTLAEAERICASRWGGDILITMRLWVQGLSERLITWAVWDGRVHTYEVPTLNAAVDLFLAAHPSPMPDLPTLAPITETPAEMTSEEARGISW